jgi:putative protease
MPLKKRRKTKKKLIKKKAVKRKSIKKKTIKKRPARKSLKAAKKARVAKKAQGNVIGIATHYFPKVRAAVIKLKSPLTIGDTVKIKGHTTDFTQNVTSIQIDRVPIQSAKSGQEVGLLVDSRVRQHDSVIKV